MDVLTITLNPAIDRMVCLPRGGRLGQGRDHRVAAAGSYAGGKGVNVARALKALGRPVRALGFSGGITGQMFERLLAGEKIPSQFIALADEMRINTTLADGSGAVMRCIEPGPAVGDVQLRALRGALKAAVSHARAVVFAGSLPPGMPPDAFRDIVAVAVTAGANVAVDTRDRKSVV